MTSERFLNNLSAACVVLLFLLALAAPRASSAQQSGAGFNKNEPAKAAAPKVSELDEAGLAKLLRREGETERRPLLVNFWATWCDPCREEMPDLVKLDEEFRARGLDLVLVSLDDVQEINKGVPEFLERMKAARIPSYLLNAQDQDAAISSVEKEWRGQLPATFLFGRDGQLAYKHMGRIKPDELRRAVEKTLGAAKETTETKTP